MINLTTQVLKKIEYLKKEIIYISKLIHDADAKNAERLVNQLYDLALFKVAITYEGYITRAEAKVMNKKETIYNHPWKSTRNVLNELKIYETEKYTRAHKAWDLYNSLKHENKQTLEQKRIIWKREGIKNDIQAFNFFAKATINLVKQIEWAENRRRKNGY